MSADPLNETLFALADPTRRASLARLALGETSVTELAEPFDMSLAAVSKHIEMLERAGLLIRGRAAQWRPCRLAPSALKNVDGWIEQYRDCWEQDFGRVDAYLRKLQATEKKRGPNKGK